MKCEKCEHVNSDSLNSCENCGAPLNNDLKEKNIYPKKGKHIDIEDITEEKEQPSFSQTKIKVRNFLLFLLLIVIIGAVYLVGVLMTETFSQEVFKKYKDIMEHSSLALIYLGYDEDINQKCIDYSENYGFDYVNIEANKISLSKKKKLRNELNIYNLTSTLVVVQDGVPITYYSKVASTDELLEFLQENYLVPMKIEDTTETLELFKNSVVALDDTIIYLPTKYEDETEIKSKAIQEICEENGMLYVEVKGYVLSNKQLKKVMSQIGFSEIQDDLVLYVSDGKVVTVLEADKTSEDAYFHLFTNRGIIDVTSGDYLKEINKSKFAKIVEEKKLNVIFISTDDCSYCERVKPVLGKIAAQNNLVIYHLNATKDKTKISNMIKELGYDDGLTLTPFVLLVENNRYVDSIIGLADKELYNNKFVEYGVIK